MSTGAQTFKGNHKKLAREPRRELGHRKEITRNDHGSKNIQRKSPEIGTGAETGAKTSNGNHRK